MKLEVKMVVVMLSVVLISAALLAVVVNVTSPLITENREKAKQEALISLLPKAKSFEEKKVNINSDTSTIYYGLDKDKKRIGLVFIIAPKGYGGPIEIMVGLNTDSSITAIKITSFSGETPGLGVKVSKPEFYDQFKGLKTEEIYLKKLNDKGKVKAITAATISSDAVTSGVREGVKNYIHLLFAADSLSTDDSTPTQDSFSSTSK